MELLKSLLGLPSRCRSLLLGVAVGLFISAALTSKFAAKIVPNPLAPAWIPFSSPNASISSQLYILFFKSSSTTFDRGPPEEVYVSAGVDDDFPETKERKPSFSVSDQDDRTHASAPGGSSSPSEHAQAIISKDDSLAAKSELAFREKQMNFSQRAYNPTATLHEEERWPNYTTDRPPAPAEDRAVAQANDPLPVDSSVLIKDSRDRTISIGNASSTSAQATGNNFSQRAYDPPATLHEEDRWPNYTLDRPLAPAKDPAITRANDPLPVDSSVLIKDSRDRMISPGNASSTSAQSTGKLSPPLSNSSKRSSGRCDLSVGRWAHDDSYPLYQPGSCPFVDEGFSCQQNGRPDAKFNRWRWIPRDCTVPRLNGTDMLERLRGKRFVFVGDSLNRNQWESMLCILRESLQDKNRIVEIHGGRISKLPGAYVFKFLDYDCRVEFYTSHFLVDEEEDTSELTKFNVRLDSIDRSERRWRKANVLLFNTGHWWTPDKIGEGDNFFREGAKVYRKLDVMVAYRKAITTWARWIDKYIDPANTRVFFRGYSPLHYMGGQWNSGGQCHNETLPIFNESFLAPYPDKMQVLDEIITHMRVPVHILNVTRLSDFRKDAHPAIYGHRPQDVKDYQDCSHWCLPGLPDTWNELLYYALFVES